MILFYFTYLFAHKTIIRVTKVPVHELDKKANKVAPTNITDHYKSYKSPLQLQIIKFVQFHTQYIKFQSVNQSINHNDIFITSIAR